jgi:hypothetical protein
MSHTDFTKVTWMVLVVSLKLTFILCRNWFGDDVDHQLNLYHRDASCVFLLDRDLLKHVLDVYGFWRIG